MPENIRKRLSSVYNKGFREGKMVGFSAGIVLGSFVTYLFTLTMVNMYPETTYLSQELVGTPEDLGYVGWLTTHCYNSPQCPV
jgi:hypothetical protein